MGGRENMAGKYGRNIWRPNKARRFGGKGGNGARRGTASSGRSMAGRVVGEIGRGDLAGGVGGSGWREGWAGIYGVKVCGKCGREGLAREDGGPRHLLVPSDEHLDGQGVRGGREGRGGWGGWEGWEGKMDKEVGKGGTGRDLREGREDPSTFSCHAKSIFMGGKGREGGKGGVGGKGGKCRKVRWTWRLGVAGGSPYRAKRRASPRRRAGRCRRGT